MTAFLTVIVVFSAINTAAILWCTFVGSIPKPSGGSRFIDALITAGMGSWALWLLAKGAS